MRRTAIANFSLWSTFLPAAAFLPACVFAQAPRPTGLQTYFEFGTVVSLGQRSVDVQSFDDRRNRLVQHTFLLSRETRADLVHVGDAVEVIYTPGTDWTATRLILLTAGIPRAGSPTEGAREVPPATPTRIAPASASPRVASGPVASGPVASGPVAPPLAAPAANTKAAPAPSSKGVVAGSPATASPAPSAARGVNLSAAPTSDSKSIPNPSSVTLGSTARAAVPSTAAVDLRGGEAATPHTATARLVGHETPAEECNRSSTDWPTQPLRLAVLDFRYPTEREESHDIGTTGGGSGTAVADLVYNRLDELNQFTMMRGDRTRLYRADFAGAARVGREMGADAVLAGTFQPQDPPPGSDPDFPPPKQYELRAGIVDTCTGQLLKRLESVECPPGISPSAASTGEQCKRLAVTSRQATDPKDQASAFRQPIAALLYPLEHDGPPPGVLGTAGAVSGIDPTSGVTLRLPAGTELKPGDQISIHAWRLTKNPTTYTLQDLRDQEIGRVTLARVGGGTASGPYTGDIQPHIGDTADLIQP